MHIGFGVSWSDAELLFANLERCKVAAGEGREVDSYWGRGEFAFMVEPKGFQLGGGKGSFFSFSFKVGGISFGLSKLAEPYEQTPNVWVQVNSNPLMVAGARKCVDVVVAVIESCGGVVLWNKLSRVDQCIDWAECDAERFVVKQLRNEVVCRARKDSFYREDGRLVSMFVGKGAIAFRVYDKELECRGDAVKRAILVERRWGCEVRTATRFEFQLRRQALKSMGVEDFDSYWVKRAEIARYLFMEWFRFVEAGVDRTHTTMAEVDADWLVVVDALDAVYGSADVALERNHVVCPNAFVVRRQGVGCFLTSVAIECAGVLYSVGELKELVLDSVSSLLDTLDLEVLHEAKVLKVCALNPVWGY